jgi:threonylcarbamoyladenosine tRNA methylthiotransferase MtaB
MPVDIITFGCRLNAYESEAVQRQAEAAGHENIIIINTCAVTQEATRQAAKAIRKLKRERPDARIVVTGCAAQIEPTRFAAMEEVALVLGNHEKMKPETWTALKASNSFGIAAFDLPATEKVKVADIMAVRETALHLIEGYAEHTRAFVQVQNGCDHRCTFCVIPYGRGNSRSAAAGEIVTQVRTFVENGVREVVLTGVDTTSWGKDLPGQPSLGTLVKSILKHVPELPRLRLSSVDAVEIDDTLKDAFANETRLMPHLHLSLQHGDDLILKRMKRRHLRADAIRFCAEMRGLRPDIAFGADMIAGFPTEDEAMFARSGELVEECGLALLHVFPYSARPGTPAALMPQLDAATIKQRAAQLRKTGEIATRKHLAAQIGRTLSVLTERGGTGHAENFSLVRFATAPEPGQIAEATILASDDKQLFSA